MDIAVTFHHIRQQGRPIFNAWQQAVIRRLRILAGQFD